ncbi:hypothetical protein CEPG_00039 [Cellulophaga phage phiSM]|uniref:hypothetical protein n=1 Tax=Cellulophaga phage phiSM TaxID=756280 RepID=UPI0002C09C66|nr:hypothetical protein CEPG_00039 [Cellulophaga phage phiSM]AGH07787.1 hypothetical protein CEPG_00039 [Cellulophaga phage phiSM]
MRYYFQNERLWKQKESLKENPSSVYGLGVLTKEEAKQISKSKNLKIINLNKNSKMAKEKKL